MRHRKGLRCFLFCPVIWEMINWLLFGY